ncbi:hypothetical protein NM208_g17211 [Fusarium decemcellulare]|uniref:Uncharacterized protein n=1 Tax=Fusarium decemcellulare TaxID=57161 RepID=A0ACC1R9V2_9HYPO|nr:hypothetical protein NM208_g17211 [Fusarium decemcellulare]
MKRSIAGRVQLEERDLFKRARTAYFGDCNPAEPPKFPNNPNAKAIIQAESQPNAGTNRNYNRDVQKWYDRSVTCANDLRPGWDKIDTAAVQAKGVANFNVDHVWELKFFTDFFETQLLPGPRNSNPKLTCDEFNSLFDKCTLNKVISQVPGPQNAEFVAMQKELNNMKGAMFKIGELKADGFIKKFKDDLLLKIEALQTLGISVDVFNQAPVRELFDRTNQRMYNTFQGVDDRIRDKSITFASGTVSFADIYEKFMSDRLDQGASEAWEFVQTWTASVEADIKELDPEGDDAQKLLKNYDGYKNSLYSTQDHYTFLANRDLASAGGTPLSLSKRDLWGRADSCPFNQETSSDATTQESTQTSQESTASTETATETTTTEVATSTAEETTSAATSSATTFSTATISSQVTSEEPTTTAVTTEQEESTSTQPQIDAQTVTSNGMVCVLVRGSNNPVCTPLETPTPNPAGTNVHVQKGCILINNSPRCASDAGSISSVYESSYTLQHRPDPFWV